MHFLILNVMNETRAVYSSSLSNDMRMLRRFHAMRETYSGECDASVVLKKLELLVVEKGRGFEPIRFARPTIGLAN